MENFQLYKRIHPQLPWLLIYSDLYNFVTCWNDEEKFRDQHLYRQFGPSYRRSTGVAPPPKRRRTSSHRLGFAHLCTVMHHRHEGYLFCSLVDFAPNAMGRWSGLSNATVTIFGMQSKVVYIKTSTGPKVLLFQSAEYKLFHPSIGEVSSDKRTASGTENIAQTEQSRKTSSKKKKTDTHF